MWKKSPAVVTAAVMNRRCLIFGSVPKTRGDAPEDFVKLSSRIPG
jgi:hypothetical protein